MKLSPAILVALATVDAANVEFFAVLEREARKRPSLTAKEATCRLCGRPVKEGAARYREPTGDVHAACQERHRARSGL